MNTKIIRPDNVKPVRKLLSAAIKYKEEFGEYPKVSVLAKYAGVSRTWVYYIFKKLENEGVVQYKSQTILNKQLASRIYGLELEN